MGSRKAHLIGGPYDGSVLSASARPPFIFISRKTSRAGQRYVEELRAYKLPGKNRQLYRSTRCESDTELFLFAGHTHKRCDDCGAFVEILAAGDPPLCMCGKPLVAAA